MRNQFFLTQWTAESAFLSDLGLVFLHCQRDCRGSDFLPSLLCLWLSGGLATWLTLLSDAQPPLHSAFSQSLPSNRGERKRAGLVSQDEGWLSFFSQPEVLPLSSGVKTSPFPSFLRSQHIGRIRQRRGLHCSWCQPMWVRASDQAGQEEGTAKIQFQRIPSSGVKTQESSSLTPRRPPSYRRNEPVIE